MSLVMTLIVVGTMVVSVVGMIAAVGAVSGVRLVAEADRTKLLSDGLLRLFLDTREGQVSWSDASSDVDRSLLSGAEQRVEESLQQCRFLRFYDASETVDGTKGSQYDSCRSEEGTVGIEQRR